MHNTDTNLRDHVQEIARDYVYDMKGDLIQRRYEEIRTLLRDKYRVGRVAEVGGSELIRLKHDIDELANKKTKYKEL